jgi:alginate O-acetyltransferase complex protein AlgJ
MLPGVVMLLVLAAGMVLSATNPAVLQAPGSLSLLDGRWASGYQDRYEEALPLRPAATSIWDLIRYVVFGEGAEGVLVGRDGWLFTVEEFGAPKAGNRSFREQIELVGEMRRALTARGVGLVVALVPSKARVHPEHLGRYRLPAYLEGRYESVREELARRGIAAPDLLRPLEQARSDRAVFLRTDTHWTPYGARVAAEALAPLVIAELKRSGSPRTRYTISRGEKEEHRGDLLNFIRLGPALEQFGPPPDTVAPNRAVAAEPVEVGLFDEIAIPVVLVGTSYSAGSLWSFADALKTSIQADVLNVAEQGRGPFLLIQDLLEGPVLDDVQADVVIWEIPERYFEFPP